MSSGVGVFCDTITNHYGKDRNDYFFLIKCHNFFFFNLAIN